MKTDNLFIPMALPPFSILPHTIIGEFFLNNNWLFLIVFRERFTLDSIGQQQPMDETDVESVGSCGEQMHTDSEDECEAANGPAEDDEDNFWMFGWPICWHLHMQQWKD